MKIRSGFVSNSSSSSFILDFGKDAVTERDAKAFLEQFGDITEDMPEKFLKLLSKVSLEEYEAKLKDYRKLASEENPGWLKSYYQERIEKIKRIVDYLKKGNTLFRISLSDHSCDDNYLEMDGDALEYLMQCYSDASFEYFNNH